MELIFAKTRSWGNGDIDAAHSAARGSVETFLQRDVRMIKNILATSNDRNGRTDSKMSEAFVNSNDSFDTCY